MSFHNETSDKSGTVLKAGDVIRVLDGPFGDAVILGFDDEGSARMSRPYAYASNVGTTGPTPLLGTETYTLNPNNLRHLLGVWPVQANGRTV